MDKYEYNLKLDQMKSLYAEEKYEDAADIADTINWNKIKNVNALVKAVSNRKNDYLSSGRSGCQDGGFRGGAGLLRGIRTDCAT